MSIRVNTNTRKFDGRTRRVQISNLKTGDTFKFKGGSAVYVAGQLHDDYGWGSNSVAVDSYTNLQTGEVFDNGMFKMVVKVKLADTEIL
jgi:hypothetical protein